MVGLQLLFFSNLRTTVINQKGWAYLQNHDAFETWQVCKSEIWTDYKMTNRKMTYVNEHMNKQIDGQMNTQMGGPTDRWTDNG